MGSTDSHQFVWLQILPMIKDLLPWCHFLKSCPRPEHRSFGKETCWFPSYWWGHWYRGAGVGPGSKRPLFTPWFSLHFVLHNLSSWTRRGGGTFCHFEALGTWFSQDSPLITVLGGSLVIIRHRLTPPATSCVTLDKLLSFLHFRFLFGTTGIPSCLC